MNDGECKACGNGSVDRIAAGAQDLKPGVRGEMVDAHNHAMTGADRLVVEIRHHVLRGLRCGVLGVRQSGEAKCGAGEGGQDGENGPSVHRFDRITRTGAATAERRGFVDQGFLQVCR